MKKSELKQLIKEVINEVSDAPLSTLSLSEMKEKLYSQGFKDSYPHSDRTMVQFIDDKKRNHQIYLDLKKPNRVTAWRINRPGMVQAEGVVGDFVGGRADHPRFSFNSIDSLKAKLNSYISKYYDK